MLVFVSLTTDDTALPHRMDRHENGTVSELDARFGTARMVFITESIVGSMFSLLLVLLLVSAASASSFRKHRVKAAFRLAILGIGIGDFVQSSSAFFYLFDLPPGSLMRTQEPTLACTLGGAISSTGEVCSALFTACLAFEGYLIVVKGVRTGEKRRAFIYTGCTLFILITLQTLLSIFVGFGNLEKDNQSGHYIWCHLQSRSTASELLSFYLWLIIALVVSLVCYLSMECKLRSMLKMEGINTETKRTIQRSRCKFISFPLIFIVAWLPTGIHRILWVSLQGSEAFENSSSRWVLLYISSMTAGGLPIANAIAFGFLNKEVRSDVDNLCRRLNCKKSGAENLDEFGEQSSRTVSTRADISDFPGSSYMGSFSFEDTLTIEEDVPPVSLYNPNENSRREQLLYNRDFLSES